MLTVPKLKNHPGRPDDAFNDADWELLQKDLSQAAGATVAMRGRGPAAAAFSDGPQSHPGVNRAPAFHTQTDEEPATAPAMTADPDAPALQQVTASVHKRFATQAADRNAFMALLQQAFGDGFDVSQAETLRQRAMAGDFGWMPKVKLVDSSALGDVSGTQGEGEAMGAYDAACDTIYLSRGLLRSDPAQAGRILMEELGHGIDARINARDALGDEGEIFSRLMSGEKLDAKTLAELKADNDHGQIVVGGERVAVEYGWFKKAFKAITGGIKKAVSAVVHGTVNLVKASLTVATGVVTMNFDMVKDGIEDAARAVVDTAKAVARAAIDTAKELHRIAKEMFKQIMQSKIFAAILMVCRFIPIPIVQLVVRIIDLVRAAYMVYQGVKNKSFSAVLSGVATMVGGAGQIAGGLGASASTLNTIGNVVTKLKMASMAYDAIANKNLGSAMGLLGMVGGEGTTLGTVGTVGQQAVGIRSAVRSGDTLGAIGGTLGMVGTLGKDTAVGKAAGYGQEATGVAQSVDKHDGLGAAGGTLGLAAGLIGKETDTGKTLLDVQEVVTGLRALREIEQGNLDSAQSLAQGMAHAQAAGKEADKIAADERAAQAALETPTQEKPKPEQKAEAATTHTEATAGDSATAATAETAASPSPALGTLPTLGTGLFGQATLGMGLDLGSGFETGNEDWLQDFLAKSGGSASNEPPVITAKSGDSWARIARQVYGDERYALALAQHNGAKSSLLKIGQEVKLPDLSDADLGSGGAFIAADAKARAEAAEAAAAAAAARAAAKAAAEAEAAAAKGPLPRSVVFRDAAEVNAANAAMGGEEPHPPSLNVLGVARDVRKIYLRSSELYNKQTAVNASELARQGKTMEALSLFYDEEGMRKNGLNPNHVGVQELLDKGQAIDRIHKAQQVVDAVNGLPHDTPDRADLMKWAQQDLDDALASKPKNYLALDYTTTKGALVRGSGIGLGLGSVGMIMAKDDKTALDYAKVGVAGSSVVLNTGLWGAMKLRDDAVTHLNTSSVDFFDKNAVAKVAEYKGVISKIDRLTDNLGGIGAVVNTVSAYDNFSHGKYVDGAIDTLSAVGDGLGFAATKGALGGGATRLGVALITGARFIPYVGLAVTAGQLAYAGYQYYQYRQSQKQSSALNNGAVSGMPPPSGDRLSLSPSQNAAADQIAQQKQMKADAARIKELNNNIEQLKRLQSTAPVTH